MFYDSNIDSGYSVDNLAPAAPTDLAAYVMENTVALDWKKSVATDLSHYVIYRNGSRYDSTNYNFYRDLNVTTGETYAYQLTAVDIHENSSGFSDEATITLTGVHEAMSHLPQVYQLSQNYPNPFNSVTIIQYQLPQPAEV